MPKVVSLESDGEGYEVVVKTTKPCVQDNPSIEELQFKDEENQEERGKPKLKNVEEEGFGVEKTKEEIEEKTRQEESKDERK